MSTRTINKPAGENVGKIPTCSYTRSVDADIGERVRSCIEALEPSRSHRAVAQSVDMTPDAFSRSLKGERSFSSIEIARLSDELGQDVHWLITGQPDPMRPRIAARHFYDHDARNHLVPGSERDQAVLADVELAYRQAYPDEVAYNLCSLPSTADEIRGRLRDGFVRPFIDHVENYLGVDVIRIAEISTSYTMGVGSHTIIIIPASGMWFYENFCIAHELGHIAAQDVDVDLPTTHRSEHEARANRFAAELLLPANEMQQIDWCGITECDLARHIWRFGVSVKALQTRLAVLRLKSADSIEYWAEAGTPSLLRTVGCALEPDSAPENIGHDIARRMLHASERRFPISLQEAHMKRIALGELDKGTLAWMLGVTSDHLEEIPTPGSPSPVQVDDLESMLGL
jgi:Zn-dependent peptidase ImmA (M78 family)